MPPVVERRIDPDQWPEVIADVAGPQLVVAGPGAGKTEFLVRRALHLITVEGVPPEQVLLLSFSRRGAADIRRRVSAGLDRSFTVVAASTFHSLALRLLEAHGPEAFGWSHLPTLLTKPEQVALVGALLRTEDPDRWPLPYRELLAGPSFADEVADFVLRCGERLIGVEELTERARSRPEWRALPGFLARYLARLDDLHRLDYGTLQARAVEMLRNPQVRTRVAARFPFVLVDEYQDTTVAQARLLEEITAPQHDLTVAGDPYQSIYSFRVPAEILEAAVRVTAGGELPGAAGPVVPAPGRGSVETVGFDQQSHEAEWIAAEIQRMHLRDGIPYHRMAVLVRSKRRFLPELSRALERRRIRHDQPNRRLVDHPAVRSILDCVRAATTSGAERSGAVRRILLGPLVALPLAAMRAAERDHAATGRDWPEIISDAVPDGRPLAALLADPTWATALPAAEGFWQLWTTLPQLADAASPRRCDDRAAWTSLSQVLERLAARDRDATLADYLAWSGDEDFEATPLLEYHSPQGDRLTLTTLHQAKGLEFDVVFVADAADGVFPDLRMRESLLGVRHLSDHDWVEPAAYARFRLQEEMRLAYTAMCRARRRVVWTVTTGAGDHGDGLPSRFLPLVAGTVTIADATRSPAEDREPVTPLEAEAWLRRIVADPAHSAPRRLAALGCLADPAGRLPRRPADFAGIRPRGGDGGLLPPEITLSPSQADDYLSCPRRYAISRRLHVDADRSVYLEFGSLIHAVLEEVERAAAERGEAHAALPDALACLERRWDDAAFGGGAWALSWHRRAQRVLTHLYELWPGSGRVLHVELPVAMDVAGTMWRGRIDRVEIDGSGERDLLHIVDYKTGTSAPTKEEASRSIQLGFYTLAAGADGLLAAAGTVASAAFWFPAVGAGTRKSVATRELDLQRMPDVVALMAEAAAGIFAEDWTPQPGPGCERCPVRLVCPAWPEGREAYRG